MFKGGGVIDALKKEYGGGTSGLTTDNKAFSKMQKGYSAAPSQKSQTGKSQRSVGSRSARTNRTGFGSRSRRSKKEDPYENYDAEMFDGPIMT